MGRLVKPRFKVVSQDVPGGTQDNRCLTRDLNLGSAEYEAGALDRDVCCQSLLLRVRVETPALSNSVVRPHCLQRAYTSVLGAAMFPAALTCVLARRPQLWASSKKLHIL
jgi:hypothetical protein